MKVTCVRYLTAAVSGGLLAAALIFAPVTVPVTVDGSGHVAATSSFVKKAEARGRTAEGEKPRGQDNNNHRRRGR